MHCKPFAGRIACAAACRTHLVPKMRLNPAVLHSNAAGRAGSFTRSDAPRVGLNTGDVIALYAEVSSRILLSLTMYSGSSRQRAAKSNFMAWP